jgi:hypothetical protein
LKLDARFLLVAILLKIYTNKDEYDELVKLMDEYLIRESDRNVFGLDDDKNNEKKSK